MVVPLLIPVLLLFGWQVAVEMGIYTRSQLPAPVDVFEAGRQLESADQFRVQIEVSLVRVAKGFAFGGLLAIGLGLVVGLSAPMARAIDPALQGFRTIPSLAWVPLFVLWMGIGEQPKIALIALGVFFPVYTNLVSGIRQIDKGLIEAAAAYGYQRSAMALEVMLPASLPSLLTGLRLGLAQGWLFLVAAELIGASQGLGFLLVDGQNSGRADIIVLSIVLLAVVGKACDGALRVLEWRLLRWSER